MLKKYNVTDYQENEMDNTKPVVCSICDKKTRVGHFWCDVEKMDGHMFCTKRCGTKFYKEK